MVESAASCGCSIARPMIAIGRQPRPICQAASDNGGIASGKCLVSTVPSATQTAPASAQRIPGSFSTLASTPLPPISTTMPASATISEIARSGDSRSPRTGQATKRDPDRDRYSEHGRLAGAEPEQRQSHERGPGADLQRRDQQQPQPHPPGHTQLLLPCNRNQCECRGADDAAEAARGQRRPLGQKMFHDREVEPPPHRCDGEKGEPERRHPGATRLAIDRHVELVPVRKRYCSCSDTAERNSRHANAICTIPYRRFVAVPT